MGECGCTTSDTKYTLSGPGKSLYLVTLAVACPYCDSPAGITIERIEPTDYGYDDYRKGEFYIDGPLKLEKWPDSHGVAIITGMRRCEFVKAIQSHLIGVNSKDFGEDGTIDECGAEAILEEAYRDSVVKPKVVKPVENPT